MIALTATLKLDQAKYESLTRPHLLRRRPETTFARTDNLVRRLASCAVLFALVLTITTSACAQESDIVPNSAAARTPEPVSEHSVPVFRYLGWITVGFLGAGGFGAYLRRRPTAFLVVLIWYFSGYHAYSSYVEDTSILPPLLAVAMSLLLGPVAKKAGDDAIQTGGLVESPSKFSGTGTLSMAYNVITIGLIVSIFLGWHVWEIIPGFGEWTWSRKMTIGTMLLAGVSVMMWIDTLSFGGLKVLKTIPTMASIFFRSRRGRLLTGITVFCLCFWHSPYAKEPLPLRWEMSFTLLGTITLLWLQPPYVLMLGASSEETGKALARLSSAVFPFRVVALLDRARTGRHVGSSFSWLTDDLRTIDERDWRALVDRLIELVPVIVLDARTDRPVVVYEANQLLLHPRRLHRSSFVISEDGHCPALSLNGVMQEDSRIRAIRADQIESVLDFGALASPSSAER